MKRHLLAAVLTGALVLAPTAAIAQEAEPETTETTVWEALGEVVGDLSDALLLGRADDSLGEDGLDDLVAQIEAVLSDIVAGIYFEAVAEAAVADVEVADGEEGDGANGEAVSTLAQCAPRGSFKALVEGMGNHGEYVTAAAHGETVELNVPSVTVTEGEETTYEVDPAEEPTAFDLTTTQGAQDLCAALDVVYQVRLLELELAWEDVDTHRDARVLIREQCQLQRLRVRNGAEGDANEYCAELRQRVKDLQAAERDAARADREAARDEAKADREAARDEAKAARDEARADREAARAEQAEARGPG
ncbi:MAG TPA: hypothetical protein VGA36_00525 [Nitriliruptorales bacterium]